MGELPQIRFWIQNPGRMCGRFRVRFRCLRASPPSRGPQWRLDRLSTEEGRLCPRNGASSFWREVARATLAQNRKGLFLRGAHYKRTRGFPLQTRRPQLGISLFSGHFWWSLLSQFMDFRLTLSWVAATETVCSIHILSVIHTRETRR